MADPVAMRSEKNYAHQLAERLGARLVDRTVSGATTAHIVDTPQRMGEGVEYPPQIDGIPSGADVVTITAGGNDLLFAPAMLYAAWSHIEPESPIVPLLESMVPSGIPRPSQSAFEEATWGLVRIVEGARSRAASARVFLVDYLTVLDTDSAGATPFSEEEVGQFLVIQRAIGQIFRDAAAQSEAELIPASSLSAGHALGSSVPWVQPFHPNLMETGGSFHPNEAGMTAIAVELERVLGS